MSDSHSLLAEAFDRHQSGRFDEAEGLYRRILATEPAEAEALHRYGLLAAQLGQLEEAGGLLVRALTLDARATEAAVNHAKILRALRRPEDAARRFRHALALSPTLLTALEGLGHAEREAGHTAAAAESYGRAARLGTSAAVLHRWGIALESLGRPEAAAEALRLSAHLDPTVPSVAVRLATILERLGYKGEAAGWYRHALVLQPGRDELRRALSDIAGPAVDQPPVA
ncbi:tetratricopeptide repeat protein [Azospirillum palustre]